MSTLNEAAISRLLLEHWDVLAVAEADVDPESEYRHEAAAVLAILRDGSGQEDILAHLSQAADALNARPDAGRDRRAAQAICDAYRQ